MINLNGLITGTSTRNSQMQVSIGGYGQAVKVPTQ